MNRILILAFALVAFSAAAQTPIISHKSHAGTEVDFFIDPSSNFGEYLPLPKLIQVIRLDDSTYVNVYLDEMSNYATHDTVHEHTDYNFAFDSINEGFHTDVEYLNFRKSSPDLEPVKPGYYQKKSERIQEVKPTTPEPARKKKKSYVIFLFGITGGGMLLMRLFRRRETVQQSIA